jgi:hypothetical protein
MNGFGFDETNRSGVVKDDFKGKRERIKMLIQSRQ